MSSAEQVANGWLAMIFSIRWATLRFSKGTMLLEVNPLNCYFCKPYESRLYSVSWKDEQRIHRRMLFENNVLFWTSRGLACCINPQPGGPGDFWSRFSSSSPWQANIKLQGSSASFGPPLGILFPRNPPYLVSIPPSATRGGTRWKTSKPSRVPHIY
jgi:hypothetical protein